MDSMEANPDSFANFNTPNLDHRACIKTQQVTRPALAIVNHTQDPSLVLFASWRRDKHRLGWRLLGHRPPDTFASLHICLPNGVHERGFACVNHGPHVAMGLAVVIRVDSWEIAGVGRWDVEDAASSACLRSWLAFERYRRKPEAREVEVLAVTVGEVANTACIRDKVLVVESLQDVHIIECAEFQNEINFAVFRSLFFPGIGCMKGEERRAGELLHKSSSTFSIYHQPCCLCILVEGKSVEDVAFPKHAQSHVLEEGGPDAQDDEVLRHKEGVDISAFDVSARDLGQDFHLASLCVCTEDSVDMTRTQLEVVIEDISCL